MTFLANGLSGLGSSMVTRTSGATMLSFASTVGLPVLRQVAGTVASFAKECLSDDFSSNGLDSPPPPIANANNRFNNIGLDKAVWDHANAQLEQLGNKIRGRPVIPVPQFVPRAPLPTPVESSSIPSLLENEGSEGAVIQKIVIAGTVFFCAKMIAKIISKSSQSPTQKLLTQSSLLGRIGITPKNIAIQLAIGVAAYVFSNLRQ